MAFENNVFINCPFDKEYKPILKAIVFTLVNLNYNPLISETINSAQARVDSIQNLIGQSKYSVHDLSRMKAAKKNELARFNMPFELGIDLGCKRFGSQDHSEKCFLILDQENYRYQRAISDIAGNDIKFHNNEPEKAVRQIRNWIRKISDEQMPGSNSIWILYNEFLADFYEIALENNLNDADIEEMPWAEYCDYIKVWLEGKAG